jgi:hypothetical protein
MMRQTGPITPVQWLIVLLAIAAGAWGWLYGLNWKRIAGGADTTHQEKLLIDLQDQLIELRAENEKLRAQLREREEKEEGSVGR